MGDNDDRQRPVTKGDLDDLRQYLTERLDRLDERINFGVHVLGYLHERRHQPDPALNSLNAANIEVGVLNKVIYALSERNPGGGAGMLEDILNPTPFHRAPAQFPEDPPSETPGSAEKK